MMMMIPFWYVKSESHELFVSQEQRLARKMGRPPWEVGCIPASTPAREWARAQKALSVGLIFDPEFWYDHRCWNRWLNALATEEADDGRINVPIGSQDPSWRTELNPPIYLTMRGLEQASRLAGMRRWIVRKCTRPDGFCVAVVPLYLLKSLPRDLELGALPEYWADIGPEVRIFCSGWLHAFNAKDDAFYRKDLLSMCTWNGTVLELGCGSGFMAQACKKMHQNVTWIGLDIHASSLYQASSKMDMAVHADIQKPLPLSKTIQFDRIVCADVLEHTAYPWEVLRDLRQRIQPEGLLIASFPNIGHWSIIEDLILGRFDETPAGILCVGHLRFGTKRNWERWFRQTGWHISTLESSKVPVPDNWIIPKHALTGEYDKESLETVQYRLVARPA